MSNGDLPSPRPPPHPPLTCQPSVSGVFPNRIQGPGRGVSDVIAKGPPERGSQGPRHHVGLRVPHPRAGLQCCCPGAATIALGSGSSGARRPPRAAGCGSAGRPGAGDRDRAPASPAPPGAGQCGSHCGPERADCRRPPGPAPSSSSRGCHIWKGLPVSPRHPRAALELPSWLSR